MPATPVLPIFIGTSSSPPGANRGIYAAQLDADTGALTAPALAAETPNPGFLARHPGGRVIYASGECGRIDAKSAAGAVNAYACEPLAGRLTSLGQQPTGGHSVTHLAVDATGRMVLAASYHGGQVSAFPLAADGQPGARSGWMVHSGQLGPNKVRQDKPHPHCVTISPNNRFVIVCDLGLDRIYSYRIDAAAATFAPGDPPFAPAAPGVGPRHCKFSPDGRFLYVINELGSSISVHGWDAATGAPAARQTISTLPAAFAGENICAEIQLHPNGRFVYGANRGHDSVAVFAREPAAGGLQLVEITPCGGKHPRHFALSPDGRWLVCANRDTHNLVVFKVDAASGRLSATGHTVSVPSPTCVLFAPAV
jgi:6-phosphogluconolactonase